MEAKVINWIAKEEDLIICEDTFTNDEISIITEYGERELEKTGVIDFTTGDTNNRKAVTTFLHLSRETRFMFKRMGEISKVINERHFNFDLAGFSEQGLIYTKYSEFGDHYGWHADKTNKYTQVRSDTGTSVAKDFVKLTIVLQLSDCHEYDGGVVQIITDGISSIEKKKGLVYAMPGWVSHQVTPITSGTRKVLIAWFTGPNFK